MDQRDNIYKTTGGFIKGVCHPKGQLKLAREAGLEWVRSDLPFPVDDKGNLTKSYLEYKEESIANAKEGLQTITVTNYGRQFLEHGIDVRTKEGLKRAEEIYAFVANDLKETVKVWQITNEVNLTHMRVPLTSDEGKEFIIACSIGVKRGNPNAIVGHNSYGENWLQECLEIEERTGGSDYIGLDLYAGTWTEGPCDRYVKTIDDIYQKLGKPVILMEFGFSTRGQTLSYARGEVDAWFKKRGINGIQGAYDNVDAFVDTLDKPDLIEKGRNCDPNKKKEMVLPLFQHQSEAWLVDCEYPHTEQGQYDYYDYLLPKLMNHPHLAGAVLYCMRDDKQCYFCGSPTCCCEIAWGLLHTDNTPKLGYYAVQKYFKNKN